MNNDISFRTLFRSGGPRGQGVLPDRRTTLDELYRSVCENGELGIIVTGDNVVQYANPIAAGSFGYVRPEQMIGINPSLLSPEIQPGGQRTLDMVRDYVQQAIAQGHSEFEVLHRRLDGSEFWVEVKMTPVILGGQRRIVSVWQDISEVVRLREERTRVLRMLADQVSSTVGQVVESIREMSRGLADDARCLRNDANRSEFLLTEASAKATQASSAVKLISEAAETLVGAAADIGCRIAQNDSVVTQAVREGDAVSGVVMRLSSAARRIGEVVTLINNIASQTNLLALNATIEAARAGDAGRGFGVVAGEVKNLAVQSGQAAGEIVTQVQEIQAATQAAAVMIGTITDTIRTLVTTTEIISGAVTDQNSACEAIAGNIRDIATQTFGVSTTMADMVEATTRTRLMSDHLLERTDKLTGETDNLSAVVEQFSRSTLGAS